MTQPTNATPAKSGGLFTGRNMIIALIGLFFCCCIGCAVVVVAVGANWESFIGNVFSSLSNELDVPTGQAAPGQVQVRVIAGTFMTSLMGGNWPEAYVMCSPDLQKKLGSASALGKSITDGKAQPTSWKFSDVSDVTATSKKADVKGTGVFTGGKSGSVLIQLERVGSDWKVAGFELNK